MNLNAAIEALDSVRFFNCRMAGMEGVEPSSSFSSEIEGLPVYTPFDSFLVYQLGNLPRDRQTSFTDRGDQCFWGRTNPDRLFQGKKTTSYPGEP